MTVDGLSAGLQRSAMGQGAGAVDGVTDTPGYKKLVKATQEFEGILISELMDDFKDGLSVPGGDTPLAGDDTLNSLAIQTLSTSMAQKGGLGIGQMLVRQLAPGLHRNSASSGGSKIRADLLD
jgi:Rod binding domain-containing protein